MVNPVNDFQLVPLYPSKSLVVEFQRIVPVAGLLEDAVPFNPIAQSSFLG